MNSDSQKEGGLSGYFIESLKPIYERSSGSKLRSLFDFGSSR